METKSNISTAFFEKKKPNIKSKQIDNFKIKIDFENAVVTLTDPENQLLQKYHVVFEDNRIDFEQVSKEQFIIPNNVVEQLLKVLEKIGGKQIFVDRCAPGRLKAKARSPK